MQNMNVTARKQQQHNLAKQQKALEDVLKDIPEVTPTQEDTFTENTLTQKDSQDSITTVDGDVFHDSISQSVLNVSKSFLDDPMKEITLEMIFYEMRVIKYDIASKIEAVKEDILIKIQNENLAMKNDIANLKDELSTKSQIIDDLKFKLEEVGKHSDSDELIEIERDNSELQQYIRRNNIEIAGIPDSVKQDELEAKVIEIGKAVDVQICPKDIEACHRLYQKQNQQGPKRTVVRFVNRKLAENLIKKGKDFGKREIFDKANLSKKIYINNNLCSYYRFLWGRVKALYNCEAIDSFWVYNGTVNLRFNDGIETMKVTHLIDLVKTFPDHRKLFV